MSQDMEVALAGVVVGAALTMLGSVVQHFLSLREDSIKRQRDEVYRRSEELRKQLLAGSREAVERGIYD